MDGSFLVRLTSRGRSTVNEFVENKTSEVPVKEDAQPSKDIATIRELQENVITVRNDVNQRITIFDNKLNELYGRLVEIFGIFASILALVTFTGTAVFNSSFSFYETVALIIGFAIALSVFVLVLHKIIKN